MLGSGGMWISWYNFVRKVWLVLMYCAPDWAIAWMERSLGLVDKLPLSTPVDKISKVTWIYWVTTKTRSYRSSFTCSYFTFNPFLACSRLFAEIVGRWLERGWIKKHATYLRASYQCSDIGYQENCLDLSHHLLLILQKTKKKNNRNFQSKTVLKVITQIWSLVPCFQLWLYHTMFLIYFSFHSNWFY